MAYKKAGYVKKANYFSNPNVSYKVNYFTFHFSYFKQMNLVCRRELYKIKHLQQRKPWPEQLIVDTRFIEVC